MPFIAVCPYCDTGRVRAPEEAIGLTAPCPHCKTSFTLVDAGIGDGIRPAWATPKPSPSEAAEVAVAPAPVYRGSALKSKTPAPSEPEEEDAHEDRWAPADPPNVSTVLAFCLVGVALIASQIPYGRLGTVLFALVGVGTAFLAWYGSHRPAIPLTAAGLNVLVLLIVSLAPTWLGINSWNPPPVDPVQLTPLAFGKDGLQPAGEWMDINKGWQYDDVRVTVVVMRKSVELVGPKQKSKRTKTPYLHVVVSVKNVGVARRFSVIDWDAKTPMKLVDSNGKAIAQAEFEGEWQPMLRRQHDLLTPGESAIQDYLFESPDNPGDFLRLEFSGGPCGAVDQTVRFQIPARPLGFRPTKG